MGFDEFDPEDAKAIVARFARELREIEEIEEMWRSAIIEEFLSLEDFKEAKSLLGKFTL